ncbi:M23 family metallopeptidase [Putridiphycobacter roseus]|nr:M23 family metallopeptidase [Putridiphycobacter roseus]
MNKFNLLFSFLIFSFIGMAQVKKNIDYNMDLGIPIKLDIALAGNFCELRPNHFHTGIDIKTNNTEGYRLYAIEDGFISRIRISPWGYGKAIYIQYNNGLTSVFAHCSDFPPLLDSLVYTLQLKNESAIIDENIIGLKIPVKKGEVVAYSGNSGSSSAPHLHFEIRETATEHAINPLLFKVYKNIVKDSKSPEIRGLKIYAITPKGYMIPFKSTYYPTQKKDGNYVINNDKPIEINALLLKDSKIAFGINTIDKLDAAYNICGIHSSRLFKGKQLIHHQEINYMDFNFNRFINSHTDYFAYKNEKKHIHKQFTTVINPLPIYPLNGGKIQTDSIAGNYKIQVMDIHQNTSWLTFSIKKPTDTLKTNPLNKKDYYFPEYTNSISMDGFEALIEKNKFYEPVQKITRKTERDSNSYFISATYQLFEFLTPVQSDINIRIKIPEKYLSLPTEKMGIVLLDHKNRVFFKGGVMEDGWINAGIRNFGKFTLVIDTIAPKIAPIDFKENQNISKYSTLEFYLSDNISGVASYKAYLNNKWVLTEYNKRNGRYIIPLNKRSKIHLVKGNNELLIKVIDRRKNETHQKFNLILN